MSDSKRTLTEISHLFLSSVRERAMGDEPRPVRTPPKAAVSIDLTPEEFAQSLGACPAEAAEPADDAEPVAPLIATLACHLGERQHEAVRAFARTLAAGEQRIGLIEIDETSCRLSCFEPSLEPDGGESAPITDQLDPRRFVDALEELNVDVDRWVLAIANPRLAAAAPLVARIRHWTLLTAADHEGLVASYRAIKGLVHAVDAELSLAILDAADEADAQRVFDKLAGVCQQFLGRTVSEHLVVTPAADVARHVILDWQAPAGQSGAGAPWQVLADFVGRSELPASASERPLPVAPVATTAAMAAPTSILSAEEDGDAAPEVIELASDEASAEAVLSAVLRHPARGLVECPVRAPAFDSGRLAVGRDRRLVLLAVVGQGLAELGAIGRAYNWLIENRGLVAMALPQLSIDAHALPQLCLLVDHAAVKLDQLQPLLAAGSVRVETYRKLRWGQRTGLLLEAA